MARDKNIARKFSSLNGNIEDSLHGDARGIVLSSLRATDDQALARAPNPLAISLTNSSAYTQNFNSLSNAPGSTNNFLSIQDWFLVEGGTNGRANGQYAVSSGTDTAGDVYSFGSLGSPDRALGEQTSGTFQGMFGARFTNETGGTITSLLIAYTGEMWRLGDNTSGRLDRLDFQISFNATALNNGTWTDVNALDFVTPTTTGALGSRDGNAFGNKTAISSTIGSLAISTGTSFWIRWVPIDATGAGDDGLGIDDFSLTPTVTPPGALSINDVSLSEGDSGTTLFTFTVTRSGGSAGVVGANWTISFPGGGSSADSADLHPTQGPGGAVFLANGEVSKTITVYLAGDYFIENDETFTVTLSAPTGGATIADGTGIGTIVNDDVPGAISIDDVLHSEGHGGTTLYTFTVSRTGGSSGAVGATWTLTLSGDAVAGDFTVFPQTGTVSFGNGVTTSQTITITVQGDTNVEPDELFTVLLSAPTGGATIADGTGQGTITNDDFPINGTPDNNSIAGTAGDDVINGLGGHDRLLGNLGNDRLDGGDGDDYLSGGTSTSGGPGDDTLIGGTGYDRAGYFTNTGGIGVTVSLLLQGAAQNTGSQGMDTLSEIEHLSGTVYADNLTGDGGDNWLWGATANSAGNFFADNDDTLSGEGGDDLITVGIGDHVADGGTDEDTFRFTENFNITEAGISVSLLGQGSAQVTGYGSWTLSNFENLSGGQGSDTLTGDDNANRLTGERGDDMLHGEGGDDTLSGDLIYDIDTHGTGYSGTPRLFIATDIDDLVEFSGNDSLDGGAGNDTALFLFEGGAGTLTLVQDGADMLVRRNAEDVARIRFEGRYVIVTGLNSGAHIGTDTLIDIEHLHFAIDGTPPLDVDLSNGVLSIDGAGGAEGNAGTTNYLFIVSRAGGSEGAVSATWTLTLSGGANAADFTAFPQTGTVSFADGEIEKQIMITVKGDTLFEPDETFAVVLSAPTGGAALGVATGVGTIGNDDNPPPPTLDLNGPEGGVFSNAFYSENGAAVPIAYDPQIATADPGGITQVDVMVRAAYVWTGDMLTVEGMLPGGITVQILSDVHLILHTNGASLDDIEAALEQIRYYSTNPDANAGPPPQPQRLVDVTLTDAHGSIGGTFCQVLIENAPPGVDLNGAASGVDFTAAYTENGAAVALGSGITITAPQPIEGIEIAITFPITGDLLFVDGTLPGGITASGGDFGAPLYLFGSGSAADWQAALAMVRYHSRIENPDAYGIYPTRTITVTVGDGGKTATATTTVTIAATNDAPSIADLNGDSVTYTEDVNTSVRIDLGSNATVTDPDSGNFNGGSLTVTGSEPTRDLFGLLQDGVITTSGANVSVNGVVIGTVSGSGVVGSPLVVTFTTDDATAARIQLLIQKIFYAVTPQQNPIGGTRTITTTLTDGDGGTTSAVSSVTVVAVNDAPVVTVPAGTTPYAESVNTAPASLVVSNAITVTDVDDTALVGATVSITANFQAGQDILAFTNNNAATFGNIAASYDGGTGVLTLTSAGGTATLAQWQSALRAVTYANSSEEPSTATRTISFTVNDGDTNSAIATRLLSVTAQNDSPNGLNTLTIMPEDTVFTILPEDFGFSDVDGDNFYAVRFGTAPVGGTLYFDADGGGSGLPVAITSFPSATILVTDIALGKLTFVPTSNLHGTGAASISFVVVDDGGTVGAGQNADTTPNTITFHLTPVNDAAVITGDDAGEVTEDGTATDSGTLMVSDVDGGQASFQVQSAAATAYGTFSIEADGDWTYQLNNSHPDVQALDDGETGTDTIIVRSADGTEHEILITINGADEAAPNLPPTVLAGVADHHGNEDLAVDYSFAANAFSDPDGDVLTYTAGLAGGGPLPAWLHFDSATRTFSGTPPQDFNGTLSIRVTATDPGGLFEVDDFDLVIDPVNDAPTSTGLDGDIVTFTEGPVPVQLDLGSNATLSDVDSMNFDGATLTLRVTTNKVATEDQLLFAFSGSTGFEVTGSNLFLDGDLVATFTGGGVGVDRVFTFNANANAATIDRLLTQLFYLNTNDANPSAAQRTIEYVITDGDGGTLTLHSYVNVVPVNDAPQGSNGSLTTLEDTELVLDDPADFGFSDPDGHGFAGVWIDSSSGSGHFLLGGSPLVAPVFVTAAQIAAGALVFVPAENANGGGYAQFSFRVVDTSGSNNIDTSANTRTINVTPVDDAPVVADSTISIDEDQIWVLVPSDFDIDEVDGDAIVSVTITGMTGGTLYYDADGAGAGEPEPIGTLPQTFAFADIAAGLLSWVPEADLNRNAGTSYFHYYVVDDEGTASQGARVYFDIEPVTDIPTGDLNGADQDDTYFEAAYTEDGAAAAIADSDVAITSDSGVLTGATIAITDAIAGDLLSVEGDLPGLITALYDPDTATLTLSGQATIAQYQAALAQIRYSSTSQDPSLVESDTQRTIEIVVTDGVSDGTPSSAPVYAYVTVTGVIDNPEIENLDGDLATFTEGDAYVLVDAGDAATLTDLDSADFSGGQLVLSFNGTGLSQDRFDVISNGIVQLTPGSVLVDGFNIGGWVGGGPGETFTVNFNANATPERIQALLHALAYRNGAGNAPTDGLRSVLITLTDGDGGTVSTSSQVKVVAVNDAPMLDLDGLGGGTGSTGGYTENGPNGLFASAAIVTDPDSADFAGGQLTATLTGNGQASDRLFIVNEGAGPDQVGASGGILTYGGVQVGTYSGGLGVLDPLVVTFNAAATAAIVQSVARMLAYSSASENPSILDRTIEVVLTDGDGGTSAPAQAVISVTAVNDAPDATGKTIIVTEDTPKTLGVADFPFTDPENHGLFSVTIVTVPGPGAGALFYDADGPGGPGLAVEVAAGTTYTVAQLGGARLTYVPPPNASGTGFASFTYTVRDNGGTDHGGQDSDTSPATIIFNVTATNDAPAATGLAGDEAAYEEDMQAGTAWLDVGRDAAITDPDSADFAGGSLTVSIIVNKAAGEDRLVLDTAGNGVTMVGSEIFVDTISVGTISADGVGLDRVITFNSGATAALVSRLIQNFSYVNTNQATPNTALRLVEFRLADGDGGTMFAYTSVSVTAVDDAPVIANFDHDDVTFVEGSAPIRLDMGGDALVTDVDSANFDGGYLQVILGEGIPGEDVIGFATSPETGVALSDGTNNGSIVSVGGVAIGAIVAGSPTANAFTVNFNGDADAAHVSLLLQALTYLNTNTANPSTMTRAIVVFVSDGDGAAHAGAVANVHVTGVNDAPTIANLQGDSGTLVEGNFGAVFIDDGRNAVISEPDSANYNGGSLTLTVTSGFSAAGDRVGIISDGTLSIGPGNVVRVGGVAIGVVSGGQHGGGSADTMVINFNTDDATVARVQTLLRGLFFANGTQHPVAGTRNFRVDLVDGDGVANNGADRNSYTTSILVIEVNDAPSGADATRSTAEDTPYVFAAADFGFSDIQNFMNVLFTDDGNSLAAVIITTPPLNGTLYLDPDGAGTGSLGTAITAGQEIAVADINAGRLVFVPAANASGSPYASFTFQVRDDGGIDNGGVDTDASPNTMTLVVNAVNDAPSGADNAFTIDEDTSFILAESHFGFTDPVESDDFLGVVITTAPTAGTLRLDGAAVVDGQFVSAADIALGKLVFVPVPEASGAPYASFTFKVRDDGGAGQDTDQSANTISFTVTAVNDAPVNAVPGAQTIAEDQSLTFSSVSGNAIQVADPDATTLTVTLSVAHGTLSLASNANLTFSGGSDGTADATMTFSGTAAAINTALAAGLTYNPTANFNGGDAISVVTTDNGQTGTGPIGTDSDSIAITILAANDPVSAAGPANFAASEETATAILGLSVGDVDAQLAPNGLYRVLFSTNGGTLTLSTRTGLTFSDGDGTADAAMEFTGTVADINAALATASFTGGLDLAGTFDLTLQVTDQVGLMVATGSGPATTATHDFTVTIAGINDAPVNHVPGIAQVVNEDQLLTFNAANNNLIQVSDVDAGAGNVTVTLAIADGALTLSTTSGLAVTGNGTNNVVLTGTLAGVNAALDGLRYLGALDASGGRTLTVTTSDNGNSGTPGALTDVDMVAITINPVNDAPSGASTTVTGSEDDPYVFTAANFGFSDPVEGHALLAVRIASLPLAGALLLNGGAIAEGQYVSVADIDAGHLVFMPAANQFGTSYASFTFQVQDSGGILNGGVDLDPTPRTMTINVTPDNLPPVLDLDSGAAGVNAALTYTENDTATQIAPAATLTDDSPDFAGGTIVAHFTANGAAEDQLALRSGGGITISSTDDTIVYGGQVIGTWGAGINGADLIVQLNANATAAAVEAVLRAITYANVSDAPSVLARTISVSVSDGDGDAASALVTVNLVAVNDAAVARADAFTIAENGAIVGGNLFANNGSGADNDVDGPALAIAAVNGVAGNVNQTIILASGASLTVNANGIFNYNPGSAFLATPTPGSGASNTPAHDSFTYALAGGNTVTVTITLTGLDSNDTLLGGAGADVLIGGNGDDTYFVSDSADDILEAVGAGFDRVVASGNYVLNAGAEVELVGTADNAGTAAISLGGNEFGQTLTGNAGNNYLDGGGGLDVLVGLGGDDVLIVDADDRAVEAVGGGFDTVAAKASYLLEAGQEVEVLSTTNNAGTAVINLSGNAFGQVVIGNAGNNYVDGGGGADLLVGLGGNDVLIVDADDRVVEAVGGGFDTVAAKTSFVLEAGQEVEVLSTTNNAGTAAINLIGNAFGQTVIGNAGNNYIDGGGGADLLVGLGGDDALIVDADDRVVEAVGGGFDNVAAKTSYLLNAGAEVEILSTVNHAGTAAINLGGNEFGQTLFGNAGNNYLDGGGGVDLLVGFGGNDTYIVDADDRVSEGAGGGSDSVAAKVSYALEAGQEIELLSTTDNGGTAAINLTGNAFGQTVIGNAGANILNGGLGGDLLVGLGGADTFAFTTALGAGNVDRIHDMVAGTDKIALDDAVFTAIGGLGALNANAFFAGAAAHDADDRIIYDSTTGALYYDADGNGAGAQVQFATLATGLALTASDFSVI